MARRASRAKAQGKDPNKALWDGLVSITLVEGRKLIPMDDSGQYGPSTCHFID